MCYNETTNVTTPLLGGNKCHQLLQSNLLTQLLRVIDEFVSRKKPRKIGESCDRQRRGNSKD